jgi:hypothetical protein
MGNYQKGRKTEVWELDAISNLVNIPRIQLENIYKDFQYGSKHYLLNKSRFRRMYKDLIQNSSHRVARKPSSYKFNRQNNIVADRIFTIFAKEHPVALTFDEFMTIYIMLQNSIYPQIRLNFFLDHYSQNNGYLTPSMGRRAIEDMSNLYGINTDSEQICRRIETNDGLISKQALIEYCINHPVYSSVFYRTV